MRTRCQRQTVTFRDRGEPVAVEVSAGTYRAYVRQARRTGVPVETVIQQALHPVVQHLRQTRHKNAPQRP